MQRTPQRFHKIVGWSTTWSSSKSFQPIQNAYRDAAAFPRRCKLTPINACVPSRCYPGRFSSSAATPRSASEKRKWTGGAVINRSVKEWQLVRSTLAPLVALANNVRFIQRDSNRCPITESGKLNQVAHIFFSYFLTPAVHRQQKPIFGEYSRYSGPQRGYSASKIQYSRNIQR